MLSHLTDLADRAQKRAMLQYRSLTKFMADVAVVVSEAQALEDALWDFSQQLQLDSAIGVWLERLGNLIGQARQGFADDYAGSGSVAGYRDLIKARILANASDGSTETMLAVIQQIFSSLGMTIEAKDWYPAAQSFNITDPPLNGQTGSATITALLNLVRIARAVAVQTMILYQDDVDAEEFVMGDVPGGSSPVGKGFDDAAAPNDPTAGRYAGAENA